MELKYHGHANKSGIYKITNLIDGKVYIGSTRSFKKRAYEHLSSLEKGVHQNKHLQRAFDRDGTDAFVFEVIEVVLGDKLARTTVEQTYLDQYLGDWERCYNFKKKTKSEPRSCYSKNPEETRRKKSEAMKKVWENPAHREHIRQANKGRKHTKEAVAKMIENREYRPMSEESKLRIALTKGTAVTVDGVTKAVSQWVEHPDCSVSAKCIRKRLRRGWDPKRAVFAPSLQNVVTQEHRERISAANTGRKHTREACTKMREAALLRHRS